MVTVTRTISPYANFLAGDDSYGIIDTSYDVTVGITDDASQLVMDVHCTKLDITPSDVPVDESKGYNTLFISALRAPRTTPPFYDRLGNEQSGWGGSWSKALEDASRATYGASWASVQSNFITAAGVLGAKINTSGIGFGQTKRISMALQPGDFDESGNYVGNHLFVQTSLWWNTEGSLTGNHDLDGELIGARDYIASVYAYGFTFDSLDYYPGMARASNQWYSCNRAGGYAQIRNGNGWRNVKNTLNPNASAYVNKGLIRKNSAWRVQELIGIGKEG